VEEAMAKEVEEHEYVAAYEAQRQPELEQMLEEEEEI
jgi:hypothetical protein